MVEGNLQLITTNLTPHLRYMNKKSHRLNKNLSNLSHFHEIRPIYKAIK
jgi:hypothetical protein